MSFGISATSCIFPKNLRTRLRPVNVCATISISLSSLPGETTSPESRNQSRPSGQALLPVLSIHAIRIVPNRCVSLPPDAQNQPFQHLELGMACLSCPLPERCAVSRAEYSPKIAVQLRSYFNSTLA